MLVKLIGFILLMLFKTSNSLLFPSSTSISVTLSVSVPVAEFFPDRRILVDWCFGVAYDLPNSVSSFYSIPIWPGFANRNVTKREVARDHTDIDFYSNYRNHKTMPIHPKDFSAGELYETIEDTLTSYGFHETCLLRSVCELAQHPFDDKNQHLLSDLVTLILSPSQHEGFLETEHVYRQTYEDAELNGFLGKNCASLYPQCKRDILSAITKIVFRNN